MLATHERRAALRPRVGTTTLMVGGTVPFMVDGPAASFAGPPGTNLCIPQNLSGFLARLDRSGCDLEHVVGDGGRRPVGVDGDEARQTTHPLALVARQA